MLAQEQRREIERRIRDKEKAAAVAAGVDLPTTSSSDKKKGQVMCYALYVHDIITIGGFSDEKKKKEKKKEKDRKERLRETSEEREIREQNELRAKLGLAPLAP